MVTPEQVLDFWFGDGRSARFSLWFEKNDETDRTLRERFGDAVERAARGELDAWEAQGPRGRLALVVLLDQFTRNIHRGSPRMFENDERARAIARRALAAGDDAGFGPFEAAFLYLPLEHSESLPDQEESVRRFEALHARAPEAHREVTASFLDYARRHEEPIRRFGRFPHRNALLGRETTPEEAEFLKQPGTSF